MLKPMLAAALMLAPAALAQAEAKGCLKGAAVGGVAGHYVGRGHAVAGAAVGCWVGHHRAAKAEQARRQQVAAARAQHPAPPPR